MNRAELHSLRARAEAAWASFNAGGSVLAGAWGLDHRITGSWQRSRLSLPSFRASAPIEGTPAREGDGQGDILVDAARQTLDDLHRDAEASDMVAALSDGAGTLIWTGAGRLMRARAERVNFTAGACWNEQAFGTNAVAVAVREGRPATVFSAEHYTPAIHDWVCYAAPILHPATGTILGALDLSTVWERHNPLALRAVQAYASEIARVIPDCLAPRLRIDLLGRPCLRVGDRMLALSPRQAEILCALLLHPQGLDLDALHAAVYGDDDVTLATLKSELSRLRHQIPEDVLASRPYRFLCPVASDLLELLAALRGNDPGLLLERCRGSLLPCSESPCVRELQYRIDCAVDRACRSVTEAATLARLLERMPDCEPASARLLELLAAGQAQGLRTKRREPRYGTLAAR
jgi:hypothetical protein